ncbi:hypothetical protein A7D27_08840 [Pseudomonas sp. 1D4]|uniref:hypothetical protein n=1 Tax=Pseudomonas sp. 1D4 TaxID=1843691 RepID=UPI00084A9722|nr:hypothetical protein [Pseudomonas sp. 1D4]OEC43877.1 hypothetical protein A7D27_08840 [Pseudomonas sp. 1D4]
MQAQHPRGSAVKATTPAIHLLGQALIGFQVSRSQASREHLEQLATQAQQRGELSAADARVIATLLTAPRKPRPATLRAV